MSLTEIKIHWPFRKLLMMQNRLLVLGQLLRSYSGSDYSDLKLVLLARAFFFKWEKMYSNSYPNKMRRIKKLFFEYSTCLWRQAQVSRWPGGGTILFSEQERSGSSSHLESRCSVCLQGPEAQVDSSGLIFSKKIVHFCRVYVTANSPILATLNWDHQILSYGPIFLGVS